MDILNKLKGRRIYNPSDVDQGEAVDVFEVDEVLDSENIERPIFKPEVALGGYPEIELEAVEIQSELNLKALSLRTGQEIEVMTNYILNKGIEIPETVCQFLVSEDLKDHIKAHGQLSKIVAPSSPETIEYLKQYETKGNKFVPFSNIPLVRNFMIVAILAIAALITSGQSEIVKAENLKKGILNNDGEELLINLAFLCSAAGIGTVFFLLSKLIGEVKDATLSKNDSTYYWAMLIMGVLSGLILSEMVVINQEAINVDSIEINRLLFALLGGFASEVVYGILQSIMGKIRALVSGK